VRYNFFHLLGDINGDGVVDINDFIALPEMLGKTLPPIT
jgi:hypothetical protein